MPSLLLLLLLLLLAPAAARPDAAPLLDITIDERAVFTVSVGGAVWLESAPVRVFEGGAWQTLNTTGSQHTTGTDALGEFSCVNVSWASATGLVLHTSLKSYPGVGNGMAIFVQQLPNGARGTNASNPTLPGGLRVMDPGNYPPVISFPALRGGQLETLGYVTWQSRMINVEYGTNVTSGPPGTNEPLIAGRGLQGLSTSGPVVLFDANFTSVVIAPMDNFKTAVHTVRKGAPSPTWDTGISSELTELPPGFEHRTMLVVGEGITQAMDTFGRTLRKAHGTNRSVFDRNVEYLSYWTDNGAYYSGGAWANESGGGGKVVNEAAFRAVAEGLKAQDLPIKIWQLDDWWYPTDPTDHGIYSNCIANWTLLPSTFPSGLKGLSQAIRTPWLLYVPFWCPNNVYADKFRFLESWNPDHPELIFAEPHPDDSLAFYREIFDYGLSVGMAGYENDYLDYNFLSIPYLRKTFGAANKWLAGINGAALERRLPVQICMALPSDAMASVQFDTMTNIRSSTDYGIPDNRDDTPVQPGGLFDDSNYNIGGSSILAWSLGLRPSKDIFWSHRPDNCHGSSTDEPQTCGRWGLDTNPGSNCEFNALVATLSTGPLGLADKAGDTNATLIRRCIAADGRILQPDKPATAVDSMFGNEATRKPPPGPVWATHTTIGPQVWHYILSVDVEKSWTIHGSDLFPVMPNTASELLGAVGPVSEWVAHPWFTGHAPTPCVHGSDALASGCIIAAVRSAEDIPALRTSRPIMVSNDTRAFDLLELAPVVGGWVLLGEVEKYVRVSRDRFETVDFSATGITATLSGSAGESTAVTALAPGKSPRDWSVQVKIVTFGASGKATVVFAALSSHGLGL